jgi:hypothetical protein
MVLSFGSAPTIVACTDMQGSTATSTTETMGKTADLPWGFFALLAGDDMSVTREIAEIVGDLLEKDPPGVGVDTLGTLRRALGIYKRRFAESYIESALGVTYEQFRLTGKTDLPEDLYRNLHWEIRNHQSGAELLICGFVKTPIGAGHMNRPVIFKISGDTAWSCEHFGVIGSGTDIGESSLYYREQSMAHPINRTLYQVYEAKRLGEKAPGVGKKTTLLLVRPPLEGETQIEAIMQTGLDFLEEQFKKHGPQPIVGYEMEAIPSTGRLTIPGQLIREWSKHDRKSPQPS